MEAILLKLSKGEELPIFNQHKQLAQPHEIDTHISVHFPEMLENLFLDGEGDTLVSLSTIAKILKKHKREVFLVGDFDNTSMQYRNLIKIAPHRAKQ